MDWVPALPCCTISFGPHCDCFGAAPRSHGSHLSDKRNPNKMEDTWCSAIKGKGFHQTNQCILPTHSASTRSPHRTRNPLRCWGQNCSLYTAQALSRERGSGSFMMARLPLRLLRCRSFTMARLPLRLLRCRTALARISSFRQTQSEQDGRYLVSCHILQGPPPDQSMHDPHSSCQHQKPSSHSQSPSLLGPELFALHCPGPGAGSSGSFTMARLPLRVLRCRTALARKYSGRQTQSEQDGRYLVSCHKKSRPPDQSTHPP